jgi:transcriptional regulator with XRE-family HTH domain
MSSETIEKVTTNPSKFATVRGKRSYQEFSELTGISAQMLNKIERGERWKATLDKFAEFCRRTNTEPNAYFEIVKRIS